MINVIFGILTRILSNSYLNVFQKILTEGNKCPKNRPSVINFYTYLGLSILSLFLLPYINLIFSSALFVNFLAMGILGALGNYFIIKALSIGELSSLAPINSYKPIVAMLFAWFYLKEIPNINSIIGIGLIIIGTYVLANKTNFNSKAVYYRILALIFSGTEAVFIKKIILLTNIHTSFLLWAVAGLIFSFIFVIFSKNEIKPPSSIYLGLLILSVGIMQYSTNYVFSKINVSYALALFQLSTILSVFLGINIFHEKNLGRKIIASFVMFIGAVIIILN